MKRYVRNAHINSFLEWPTQTCDSVSGSEIAESAEKLIKQLQHSKTQNMLQYYCVKWNILNLLNKHTNTFMTIRIS